MLSLNWDGGLGTVFGLMFTVMVVEVGSGRFGCLLLGNWRLGLRSVRW